MPKLGGGNHTFDRVPVVVEGKEQAQLPILQEMATPDPKFIKDFDQKMGAAQKRLRAMEEKVPFMLSSLSTAREAMNEQCLATSNWMTANETWQRWVANYSQLQGAQDLDSKISFAHNQAMATQAGLQLFMRKHVANYSSNEERVKDLAEMMSEFPDFFTEAATLRVYAGQVTEELDTLRQQANTPRASELQLQQQLEVSVAQRKLDSAHFEQETNRLFADYQKLSEHNKMMADTMKLMQTDIDRLEARGKLQADENFTVTGNLSKVRNYVDLIGSVIFSAANDGYPFEKSVILPHGPAPAMPQPAKLIKEKRIPVRTVTVKPVTSTITAPTLSTTVVFPLLTNASQELETNPLLISSSTGQRSCRSGFAGIASEDFERFVITSQA